MASTPKRDREQEHAEHWEQLQMTSPSMRRERAAAASELHRQNPVPPLPQPFLHLPPALPSVHTQLDPFVPAPDPSPCQQVAAINAHLATLQIAQHPVFPNRC